MKRCGILKASSLRQMTEREIGWLAGMIDADGTIYTVTNRGLRKGVIRVHLTDRDVIDRLHEVTGVGRINDRRGTNPLSKKPSWIWNVQRSVDVFSVLCQVYPDLSLRKRAAADEAMAAFLTPPLKAVA